MMRDLMKYEDAADKLKTAYQNYEKLKGKI